MYGRALSAWGLVWLLGALSEGIAQPPGVVWQTLPQALAEATAKDRPVLVYVHAPWCGPCRKMEREVFPATRSLLDRFARAGLDFDDHESWLVRGDQGRTPFEWARHLGIEATPGFVFLEPNGAVITRATGYQEAGAFSLLLAYVATGAYRHASFEEYVEQASIRH